MKKIKLQMLGLSVNDLLSREQMKKIMGGSGTGSGGSGSNDCYFCQCKAGASVTISASPSNASQACQSFCKSSGGVAYLTPGGGCPGN